MQKYIPGRWSIFADEWTTEKTMDWELTGKERIR
jgi:hypothetical protein